MPKADNAGGPSVRVRCRPAHTAQGLAGDVLRSDHRVEQGDRSGTHGGEVVDVGQHGGDARAVGVGGHERRQDRLAPHYDVAGPLGQHRAVVTRTGVPVTAAEHVGNQADVGLGQDARQRAQVVGEAREVGHGGLLGVGLPRGGCLRW
jgi:hypothetical protein